MRRFSAIAFLACILFAPLTARAGEVALKISDVSGLSSPWPLVAGIPFPGGEVKDPSAIRVTGGGREIASQVDVAATWRDGSIRWAFVSFTAPVTAEYRVEYGEGVARGSHGRPLQVRNEPGGGFTVDTGAAVYRFEKDKLLPEQAWLVSGAGRTQILEGSGNGAYLVDNSGQTARVAGKAAGIEQEILKEGPRRFAVKRSGWYVTESGEKLARAEAWLYFSAGVPYVKITHSLILTEDTNKVWIKDYGLEFKPPSSPSQVYCAVGEAGNEDVVRKAGAEGRDVFLLQDTYPHFAEKEYKAAIGISEKGKEEAAEEFKVAGDWAHGDYGSYGVTLVMPWLAERFPKEISFGASGARAVLWSGRCGRELDFRAGTLAKEYWQSWAEKGPGSPGMAKLSRIVNNAQGASRTHDVWFLPRGGTYNEEQVKKTALAAARNPLVMADPEWLCFTEALGWPMRHKDTERFPEEENLISEAWKRLMLPDRVFPMRGFINWGHGPYLGYRNIGGKWYAVFRSYGNMNVYNVRRHVWSLFARSGERVYYDFGHRFNRLLGDFGVVRWDAPDKLRGAFTIQRPPVNSLPFYWGNESRIYDMNCSSSDIGNWLMEYYLTGDEYCRDITVSIGEAYKKSWNLEEAVNWRKALSFLTLRKLVILYMREWDEDFGKMAKDLAHALIDVESQSGVKAQHMTYGCAMYKDQRHLPALYMYYKETGDDLGKKAFLKILAHRYRFYRLPVPVSYQSAAAFAYPIAYFMTGNEGYIRVLEQTWKEGTSGFSMSLEEELSRMPENPSEWTTLPNLGVSAHTHFFLGLPSAMKFFADKGFTGKTFPSLVKSMRDTSGRVIFSHATGRDTVFNLFCVTPQEGEVKIDVFPYPPAPEPVAISGVKMEAEERIPTMVPITYKRPAATDRQYHVLLSVPASAPSGLYLLSFRGNDPFVVLDATSEKVALYSPEGFWSAFAEVEGDGWAVTGQRSASRLGDRQPFFFRVPEGLENLEVFLGRPAGIRAPDGTAVLEDGGVKRGRLSIPVEGRTGIWSIESDKRTPLVFFRLLNVEPVAAFGSPDRLPDGITGKISTDLPAAAEKKEGLDFVDGIDGKALQLSGKRILRFPRGRESGGGGYTHFPGRQGTVEFWLKPRWSAHDILLGEGDSFRVRSLFTAPHLHLGYRYGTRASQKILYSDLILELLGTFEGAESLRPFLDAKSLIGREEHHLLSAGEWVHLAFTWAFARPGNLVDAKDISGDLAWPVRWRIFGPFDRGDPVLPEDVLSSYPDEIEINGKTFSSRDVVVRNTLYEFPGMLENEPSGRAAYVFLKLNSPRTQEVTLGMGADWWMQAWVNGKLIHDTTGTSNEVYPFSIWNHTVKAKLEKGENILAVRFIRGGGSTLALGGPRELKNPGLPFKWEFAIFVDGHRLEDYRSPERVRFLRSPGDRLSSWQEKCEDFILATEGEDILLGPLDGAIDMLRISDVVRYNQDFSPPRKAFAQDKNTRALFLFDGSLGGASSFSPLPLEAR